MKYEPNGQDEVRVGRNMGEWGYGLPSKRVRIYYRQFTMCAWTSVPKKSCARPHPSQSSRYDNRKQTSSSCLGPGDLSTSWAVMRTGAELEWPLTVVVNECSGRVSGHPVGQNQHPTHRQGPHFLIPPSIWSLSESDPSFNRIEALQRKAWRFSICGRGCRPSVNCLLRGHPS